MTRKRRTYNVRHIRRDYSYTIQEIAALFDLHKNTLSQWLKAGLKPIDRSRPVLIHGSDLVNFLLARQSARRARCQPDEFFCFRCRAPRHPLGRKVDVQPRNAKLLNLVAVCAKCSTTMRKAGSAQKQTFYCQLFSAATPAPPHISETPNTSDNRDLTGEK
jgi:hypothetical protein